MSISQYLRHQADACMRIARAGFDLGTAERLRVLASELRTKADEIELQDPDDNSLFEPHIGNDRIRNGGNGYRPNGGLKRG